MDVVVNAAMSADGKLSTVERRQINISGEHDFDRVARLRASVDAIMVGIGTVLADDPHLTLSDESLQEERREQGKPAQPARIIVDSEARTPADARVLDGVAPTHLATSARADSDRVKQLESTGATVHEAGTERVDLEATLRKVSATGIESLLVEGGGEVIFSVLEAGLADELLVFVGPMVIGGANAPTLADGTGFTEPAAFVDLSLHSVERLDDGVLLSWRVP